jgi:hypothetical protein
MRDFSIDDRVRLTRDIPEQQLVRGETGIIRSTWFAPETAFEVEFHHDGNEFDTRCLLRPEQVELDERTAVA